MEGVNWRRRGKLVKLLFKYPDNSSAALVFDREYKSIRFGGALKVELIMRDMVKKFFNAKNIVLDNSREIKYRRKVEDDSGQVRYEWRTRKNGRIVYKFKCEIWRFNLGYKRMCQVRSEGELKFDEVESIGRILN